MDAVWEEREIKPEKGHRVFLGSPTDGLYRTSKHRFPFRASC